MIKVNIINKETKTNVVPPDKKQWEEHKIISVTFLPKMQNLSLQEKNITQTQIEGVGERGQEVQISSYKTNTS